VLGANLMGDWVRDRLDPKMRQLWWGIKLTAWFFGHWGCIALPGRRTKVWGN